MKTPSKHTPRCSGSQRLCWRFPYQLYAQPQCRLRDRSRRANAWYRRARPSNHHSLHQTLAANIDRQDSAVEKLIIDVAEAMSEDKFNFTRESLKIPGSAYKGMLTFAGQLKHVEAGNYFIWSTVTGDKLAEGLFNDGSGPDNLKTKPEIVQFLKDSFALGSLGSGNIDAGKHAAGGREIDAHQHGDVQCSGGLQPLRTDGGVSEDEWNRADGEPSEIRLIGKDRTVAIHLIGEESHKTRFQQLEVLKRWNEHKSCVARAGTSTRFWWG